MGPLSDAVLMQASKIKMSCAFQLADLVGCEVSKILQMSHCTLFLPSSCDPMGVTLSSAHYLSAW